MTDKQLSFKDNELIKIMNQVHGLFQEGRFIKATEELEKAHGIDFDYPGVTSSLKCANFWLDKKKRLLNITDNFERGEYLMSQWNHFTVFFKRLENVSEKCLYSLKQWVFGTALNSYKNLYEESGIYNSDVLLHIGRCYKGIGNYENAIEYLEIASQQKSGNPAILTELADCYALINELRVSKVFFREAFFIDPRSIELNRIESPMIQRLIDKLKEKGLSGQDLAEWIPVYGVIYGVFNVKRELRPIEFGKLKQSIFKYENDLRETNIPERYLIPRLIKHYFWLIDHYVSTGEAKSKIDEVLAKVKKLDPVIYKEYTK